MISIVHRTGSVDTGPRSASRTPSVTRRTPTASTPCRTARRWPSRPPALPAPRTRSPPGSATTDAAARRRRLHLRGARRRRRRTASGSRTQSGSARCATSGPPTAPVPVSVLCIVGRPGSGSDRFHVEACAALKASALITTAALSPTAPALAMRHVAHPARAGARGSARARSARRTALRRRPARRWSASGRRGPGRGRSSSPRSSCPLIGGLLPAPAPHAGRGSRRPGVAWWCPRAMPSVAAIWGTVRSS